MSTPEKRIYLLTFEDFNKSEVIVSDNNSVSRLKDLYKSVNIDLHVLTFGPYSDIDNELFRKVFDRDLTPKQCERLQEDIDAIKEMSKVLDKYQDKTVRKQTFTSDSDVTRFPFIPKNVGDIFKDTLEPFEEPERNYGYLTDVFTFPKLITKAYFIYYTELTNVCIVSEHNVDSSLRNLSLMGSVDIHEDQEPNLIGLFHEQSFTKEEAMDFYKSFVTLYDIKPDNSDLYKRISIGYEFSDAYSISTEVLLKDLGTSALILEPILRRFKVHKKGYMYLGIRKKPGRVPIEDIITLYEDEKTHRNVKTMKTD